MLPSDVLNEPLFFNKQISQPATSPAAINTACPAAAASFVTPQQKPLMLSAGITKVAHLWLSLQLQQPQLLALELNSVLLALPPAWRAVVSSAPAFTWLQVRSASGRQLDQDAQTGQLHTIGPHLQLQQVPLQPVLDPSPVQVISRDPSRPWRGPAHQSGELSTLRQMMEVPNEPGLSPNNGLENALLSDQSMASNPRKGQAKRSGAKTTSHDGKAGHVMTHVCHCVLQED
ncbi:TPA: hypothetical protein ACH3X2_001059 [Trebouxia sp. C0005]